MALVFDSSMQYEEDEVFEGEVEGEGEGEETNIVELARIIPYLCSSQMNPVWQVMWCHQTYLRKYLSLHHRLLHSAGPLSPPVRQVVALLASARLSCCPLVEQHRQELRLLGHPGWAEGLEAVPEKVRRLQELNMLLAHRPWQMTRDNVAELTAPGPDSWSLSELVSAIILMCHFHSLSSFIQSCVLMEPQAGPEELKSSSQEGSDSHEVEELLGKMTRLKVKAEVSPPEQEELRRTFNTFNNSSDCDLPLGLQPVLQPGVNNFVQDINFQYVDFARREEEFNTFRIQDFSWDEEGYSTIARFDEDTAQLLDDKFRTIYNLTYGTMGSHCSIDTSLFRRASWNYIQCVWGVRHDDYDYHEVNELLHRDLKTYIKTSSCYPERCSQQDYDNIMKDFKRSEKIHFLLLVGEAKLQSCLLYAMRAVSDYFNSR